MGKDYQQRASKRFLEIQDQIMKCLQNMDHELLLVFKVMDYISSIDNKLGRPINNYYYTAKYSFRNSIQEAKGLLEYFKWSFYLYKILFTFKIYEYLLKFGLAV